MKMKVQKAYIKKVMLLLLLLQGSMGFSFPDVEVVVTEEQQELSLSAEFTEQHQDLKDGSLPGIAFLKPYFSIQTVIPSPYFYLSLGEAKIAVAYLRYSRTIDPAFDGPTIIYPFHSFL